MWEYVAGIIVTSKTLKQSPNRRQCGQKAEEAGVVGIALIGIVPSVRIQTEEHFNVLVASGQHRSFLHENPSSTYSERIGKRAKHVAKEEITKLDGVYTGKKQPPLATVSSVGHLNWIRTYHRIQEPFSSFMVQNRQRQENDADHSADEDGRILGGLQQRRGCKRRKI